MPNRWARASMISYHVANGAIEIGPPVARSHDVLEVLLQGQRVLNRILDDGADEVRGEALRIEPSAAEVAGFRPGPDPDRDGLGGRQRPGRGLELQLAVDRLSVAQLAEDRDHPCELL